MKKIIYSFLIAFSTALAFTSCTEEEVAPKTEALSNGGGSGDVGRF